MEFDLIIVGGGLAGLSLACALRNTRLKIALLENHLPKAVSAEKIGGNGGWDARVYAISPANASVRSARHDDTSRTPARRASWSKIGAVVQLRSVLRVKKCWSR